MQALISKAKTVQLDTHHKSPTPAAGDVLIRPTRLAISDADIRIARGELDFTGVLGHQFVGIVEDANGREAKKWVSKRVVVAITCVCGRCDMCRSGLRAHCRQRTVLGISGRDGCFAERFTLPARNLVEVPDHVDDDRAVFTEPLAAARQILQQLTIVGRPYITVLGDGRLGLLCAQVLSQLNATVRCVGKHPEKLQLCEKWKVKHRLLDDVGLRADQDIVVDCTGSSAALDTAMQMVRPRGTIVLKTFAHDVALDLSPLTIKEIQIIGSRAGPLPDALATLSAEQVDVLSLISRRMKLSDGIEALKIAAKPTTLNVLLEA